MSAPHQQAKPTDSDEVSAEKDFSVIKFWDLFSRKLPKKTIGALGSEFVSVQQDAYGRLATLSEDEDEVFATYDYGRKERDESLRFIMQFAGYGFMLEIEGIGMFGGTYTDTFDNEKDAANQLFAIVTMLANGQLSALLSFHDGEFCANELLIHPTRGGKPVVISTQGDYRWWWTTDDSDSESYTCQVLTNAKTGHTLDTATAHCYQFLCDYDPDGHIIPRGRTISQLLPLTKADFQYVFNELDMHDAGKEIDESDWKFFYRSWEFWLAIAVCIGAVYYGNLRGIVPDWIVKYPMATWPVSIILCYLLLIPALQHKQSLLQQHPDHPWVRFDRWLRSIGIRLAISLLSLASLASNFGPVYVPTNSTTAYPVTYFLSSYPWLAGALALYGVGIITPWLRHKRALVIASLSSGVAAIALWAFNIISTNTDVETPEPYVSFILFSSLAAIGLGLYAAWSIIRAHFNRVKNDNAPRVVLWRKLALPLAIISSYISAAMLLYGAYLIRTNLTPDMVQYGSVTIIEAAIGLAGLASLGAGIIFGMRRHNMSLLSLLLSVSFFVPLVALGFLTTDKINDMPTFVWLMCFGGAFISLLGTLPHGTAYALDKTGALKDRNFGPPENDQKPEQRHKATKNPR